MRRSSSYHGCVCVEHDFVEIQNGLLFSRFDTLALYFTSTLVRALARSHEHFRITDTLALYRTLMRQPSIIPRTIPRNPGEAVTFLYKNLGKPKKTLTVQVDDKKTDRLSVFLSST